jgi:hypothetical protein
MKKIYAISIPVLLIAAVWIGCSGDITPPVPAGSTYYVEALLAKNLDTDLASIVVTLDKNDSVYMDAAIMLAGLELGTYQESYIRNFGASEILVDSSYTLNIKDGDSLNVNLTISLSGAFAIDGPAYRQFNGGAESVQWTPSIGSDGYILATQPPPDSAGYDGYAAYYTVTTGSIPPETFLNGIDRILGTHSIYVAAYTGAPTAGWMGYFDIPADNAPANNISMSRVSGRVAGMLIAPADSIIVTE